MTAITALRDPSLAPHALTFSPTTARGTHVFGPANAAAQARTRRYTLAGSPNGEPADGISQVSRRVELTPRWSHAAGGRQAGAGGCGGERCRRTAAVMACRCEPVHTVLRPGLPAAARGDPVSQSPTSIRPALLDITGVAERLGVTVRHVRRVVAERRIPHIKWGG